MMIVVTGTCKQLYREPILLSAAQRAIESRKEHGIVKDPLAEALAGPEAMQAALQVRN